MRLVALTIRNYRVHRERTVEFDPSRNLIGGPNESGKSTLAEAIHRALFLRARTGGAVLKGMRSTRHPGHPEVALTFEARGERWELEKRFAGTGGTAILTNSAGKVLRDDEAEAEVAEMLKSEAVGGGGALGRLSSLWSHLWVWQGRAGHDPGEFATEHRDNLFRRLQQDGLAAVMQSDNDRRVREKIAAARDAEITTRGAKAGSPQDRARIAYEHAAQTLARARETATRLAQAVDDHRRAEEEIAGANRTIPGLKRELEEVEAGLAEAAKRRATAEAQQRALQEATARCDNLVAADTEIRELRQKAAAARDALAPAAARESELAALEAAARERSQAAELAERRCGEDVRRIRRHCELAAATVSAFEKAADRDRLADRAAAADRVRAELATARDALSRLPEVTSRDVEAIRRLDRTVTTAAAALEAMGAAVELVAADTDEVTLDGLPLSPGESRSLTDIGELAVGPGTRLRIRPGGGTSLADARRGLEAARAELAAALDRHALRDADSAAEVLARRQEHGQEVARLEAQWKAMGGESLADELADATAARDAAEAEVARRRESMESPDPAPESPDAARRLDRALHQALAEADAAESAARRSAEIARAGFETAAAGLRDHRERTAADAQAVRDLDTRLDVLVEKHGDDPSRDAAVRTAAEAVRVAEAALDATRGALAALGPERLANDLTRLQRSIGVQDANLREAEGRRIAAAARLAFDGTSDPVADLSAATVRHAEAERDLAAATRRAAALDRLHQLFDSCRQEIDHAVVRPLAERVSGYLQCLFGPGAEAGIDTGDGAETGFHLLRPGQPACPFDVLSGGAKEQVAAAVRLAMAEILAADHDHCLPVVFDDAFAFTDPQRIRSLPRMLDLAASRGLQIVVLTCNPDDYAALGARHIPLPPPDPPDPP